MKTDEMERLMKSIFKLYPWRTVIALFLAILSALLLPGMQADIDEIVYGFPLRFLSVFPGEEFTYNERLLSQIFINIVTLFIDFYIFSVVINLIVFAFLKVKKKIWGKKAAANNDVHSNIIE